MPLKGDVVPNIGDVIQSDLERYIKIASHCILHMNGTDGMCRSCDDTGLCVCEF